MSERPYTKHAGRSLGAIRKAKEAGRMVVGDDVSVDAATSDVLRAAATDPSKSREAPQEMKPVARRPEREPDRPAAA